MMGGAHLERQQWRQLAWITAGAIAIFFAVRFLPTGTNLSHMDFRVDPRATNAIEFCDPLNPQFIPVVAVKSPVEMAVRTDSDAPAAGREVHGVVTLRTASGKPIAPEDLLYVHTRRLHLMIVDPALQDYRHVHPEPGAKPGEWTFSFTPHFGGTYRVFADFTPTATQRGLYASADLEVAGPGAARAADAASDADVVIVQRDDIRFTLTAAKPMRAGQPMDLRFELARLDGASLELAPVMDSYAHLVAIDAARSGFAHLHPVDSQLDPGKPAGVLNFKLTIPKPGRYVIWAQVNERGHELFVPFWFEVR